MLRLLIAVLLTIASTTTLAAQSEYKIRPGDTLAVTVLEDQTLNGQVLVLPDGSINLPVAGNVQAGGRSVAQIESAITQSLTPNFVASPSVTVAVTGLAERAVSQPRAAATIDVFAIGEFNTAGKITISPGTTLLQFLAQSGGMTRFAATKRIQLRRYDSLAGNEKVYGFNYDDVLAGARNIGSTQLQDGDVVVIPERRLFE